MAVVLRNDLKMASGSSCLEGAVILPDREYKGSVWKEGQFSLELNEFEGLMELRRKCFLKKGGWGGMHSRLLGT